MIHLDRLCFLDRDNYVVNVQSEKLLSQLQLLPPGCCFCSLWLFRHIAHLSAVPFRTSSVTAGKTNGESRARSQSRATGCPRLGGAAFHCAPFHWLSRPRSSPSASEKTDYVSADCQPPTRITEAPRPGEVALFPPHSTCSLLPTSHRPPVILPSLWVRRNHLPLTRHHELPGLPELGSRQQGE